MLGGYDEANQPMPDGIHGGHARIDGQTIMATMARHLATEAGAHHNDHNNGNYLDRIRTQIRPALMNVPFRALFQALLNVPNHDFTLGQTTWIPTSSIDGSDRRLGARRQAGPWSATGWYATCILFRHGIRHPATITPLETYNVEVDIETGTGRLDVQIGDGFPLIINYDGAPNVYRGEVTARTDTPAVPRSGG